MISTAQLKNVERLARIFLISLCLVGSSYKFFHPYGYMDGFVSYYMDLFEKASFGIPTSWIFPALYMATFIEMTVGLLLIFGKTRTLGLYSYFCFIMIMFTGEYFMDNFHNVNGIPDYLYMGLLCLALPHHQSIFKNDPTVANN